MDEGTHATPEPHPDLITLSEVTRTHDALLQQLGMHPFKDILHIDEEVFRGFAVARIPIPTDTPDYSREAMIKMFTDAFTLGVAFAERRKE